METYRLERFAKYTRRYLLEQVANKLQQVIAAGSDARRYNPKQVQGLEDELKKIKDKNLLIDKVAYTWFNRFCALRFMDVNNYTRVNIISPLPGQFQPEILAEAKAGHIDQELVNSTNRQRVFDLLSGKETHPDPQTEAYRILIISNCNYYAQIMPFLFEYIADWTELLMPDDLLSGNSILSFIREALTPGACKDVEVIGWLYQFYISDRHDEVVSIAKGKKIESKDIPAATQLFTPHWIVRYMIQNTLGRLWMLNNPSSDLQNQMEFYIKPIEPIQDYLRIKSPEEIKLCDPCSGSGHVLTYAFDLLFQIYSEMGYEPISIPKLIITKNLYGIEIDERAGELGAFALTMKAREKDKTWFSRSIKPNICVMQNVRLSVSDINSYMDKVGRDIFTHNFENTLQQFEYADTFGALIVPMECDVIQISETLEAIQFEEDMFLKSTHDSVMNIIKQTEYLSPQYHVVVTNPPYMNSRGMNELLKGFLNDYYSDVKSDLFSAFIVRNIKLTLPKGQLGFMTPFVWMFISSYEKLRKHIISHQTITSLIQLEYSGFEGATVPICTFTLENTKTPTYEGGFIRLSDFKGADNQAPKTIEAIANPNREWFYRCSTAEFKALPGSPIAYWLTDSTRKVYKYSTELELHAPVRQGMATGDNNRFTRFWFEVGLKRIGFLCSSKETAFQSGKKWFPYNKGGVYRKWYGNNETIIQFDIRAYQILKTLGNHCPSEEFYFKESITWTFISSSYFGARYCGIGFVFDVAGSSCFPRDNVNIVAGFLCSKLSTIFLKATNPTLNFQAGNVKLLPLHNNISLHNNKIVDITHKTISLTKSDWDSYETSWDFEKLPLIDFADEGLYISESYHKLCQRWMNITLEMQQLEEENNRIFICAYGLLDEQKPDVQLKEITLTCNPYYRYGVDEELSVDRISLIADFEMRLLSDTIKEYMSYAVGCMLGRFSIDKPGLILANQGETVEDCFENIKEPRFVPDKDNVIPILDGEWFADDIVNRFYEFIKVTFGEANFSLNLCFIEDSIGKSVRAYFLKDFYTDHVKRYKKRPIYWLFSSPNGSFNTLIYMHRYTPDTVSIILNGYLREYVYKLKSKASDLEQTVNGSSTSQKDKIIAGKELDKIKAMIIELDYWERDVLFNLAAKKLEIDLDDGVKVNYLKFGSALKKIPGLDKGEF